MKECSVIINARLGSTRLPGKMIMPFAGTTLLDIALRKLADMNAVNKYFAAHENEHDLMNIYHKYDDVISFLPRSLESVEKGKRHQSITFAHYALVDTRHIMTINPCCPLSHNGTYEEALNRFHDNEDIRTMTSVIKRDNIFFDLKKDPINISSNDVSTQGNDMVYEMAHTFHIFDIDFFMKNGYFWDYTDGNPELFAVDDTESLDIDYLRDFMLCEYMYEKTYSSNSK